MDEGTRKRVLRLFTYGLYALTSREGDDTSACTVNWATQVSFSPTLIAVSVEQESYTGRMARRTGVFALCIYAEEQRELAGLLGRHSVNVPRKFADVDWSPGSETGCPMISGTLGAVECRIVSTTDAGDSVLIVAEVIAVHALAAGTPLTMAAAGWKHAG